MSAPPIPLAKLTAIAVNAKRPVEDVIELWTERAAIREFEGGAKRKDAEEGAMYDTANMMGGRR